MKSLTLIPGRFAPYVLGLLRIVLALLLIPHWTAKLFGRAICRDVRRREAYVPAWRGGRH